MSRQDVRVGIAKYFGGSTLTTANWYQPTPLVASGLAGVRAYYSTRIDDHEYFQTLTAGRGMGALMCVHLPQTTETRLAIGGILNRPYAVELYVFHLSTKPPSEDAQADLDDLIDAIVARLRADPTLGMGPGSGSPVVVIQAGEGERGITVNAAVPYTEPPATTRGSAVISFSAETYPAG